MKLTSFLWTGIALAHQAAAFWGQMSASDYYINEGGVYQTITLTDYSTGSKYSGLLWGGFNGCADGSQCNIYFTESGSAAYNFPALMWRTSDGCHNIDFEGALDAHHGYCCGSLPCDFGA